MNLSDGIVFTRTHRESWRDGSGAKAARTNSNHALRVLGDIDLKDLETKHFTQIRETLLAEKYSASQINQVMSAVSTVVNELYDHGFKDLSVPGFKRMKIKNTRPDFFTEEEIARLLESSRSLSDDMLLHDSILFSYKTGCRQGELLSLEYSDINFTTNEICFRDTKNGDDHFLPIPDDLGEVLGRRFDRRIDSRLFPWDGPKNGADHLRKAFVALRTSLGIAEKKLWHTIRHTTATHLVSKGAQLRVIMGVLNHKRTETTLRYAKVADKTKKEALDLL